MAADQVEIQIPKTVVPEKTGFTATAYFRTRSTKAASTPTTVHYRVDCLSTRTQIKDWTSVSAASSVSIAIGSAENTIQDSTKARERRQLIVKADDGLSTQAIGHVEWLVDNLYGVT